MSYVIYESSINFSDENIKEMIKEEMKYHGYEIRELAIKASVDKDRLTVYLSKDLKLTEYELSKIKKIFGI